MKRIVKIEGVGSVVFPDSMSDSEVSQAAGRLYDDANSLANVPQAQDEDTSRWVPIQSGGKRYAIHPEDLDEAKRRDPKLQILDQPQPQSDWVHVQFADNSDNSVHQIHPADVNQALIPRSGRELLLL